MALSVTAHSLVAIGPQQSNVAVAVITYTNAGGATTLTAADYIGASPRLPTGFVAFGVLGAMAPDTTPRLVTLLNNGDIEFAVAPDNAPGGTLRLLVKKAS